MFTLERGKTEMTLKFLQRSIWQRLVGTPATTVPADPASWRYNSGTLTLDLDRLPELAPAGGAVRLEGGGLPDRVLVVRDETVGFVAFHNRCTHLGHRRLDPVPGTATVQCCSIGKSTYDLDGKKIFGPAPAPLKRYPVALQGRQLVVRLG
jgi:Rieske Fe-S protein